jgi:hypothetical protein
MKSRMTRDPSPSRSKHAPAGTRPARGTPRAVVKLGPGGEYVTEYAFQRDGSESSHAETSGTCALAGDSKIFRRITGGQGSVRTAGEGLSEEPGGSGMSALQAQAETSAEAIGTSLLQDWSAARVLWALRFRSMNDHFLGFVRDRDHLFAFGTWPLLASELVADRKSCETTWAGNWDWHSGPRRIGYVREIRSIVIKLEFARSRRDPIAMRKSLWLERNLG